jgi:DNA-binding transcriptional ArsR family regulator
MNDSDASLAFAALAHPQRLAIYRRLVVAGTSGLTAGEIAACVGISPASLTFHMKELERAHLTHSWREGRFIRSALRVESMRALVTFLTEDCCGGRPELCGTGVSRASRVCCEPGENVA